MYSPPARSNPLTTGPRHSPQARRSSFLCYTAPAAGPLPLASCSHRPPPLSPPACALSASSSQHRRPTAHSHSRPVRLSPSRTAVISARPLPLPPSPARLLLISSTPSPHRHWPATHSAPSAHTAVSGHWPLFAPRRDRLHCLAATLPPAGRIPTTWSLHWPPLSLPSCPLHSRSSLRLARWLLNSSTDLAPCHLTDVSCHGTANGQTHEERISS